MKKKLTFNGNLVAVGHKKVLTAHAAAVLCPTAHHTTRFLLLLEAYL